MALGLAVTWDNPDIQLEHNGNPVAPTDLEPGTEYEIVARIWNGSTDAPAVDMPVRFSYLAFGVDTVQTPIGESRVDLPVKGAPGCPAYARHVWTTPTEPGHYCLQVELIWADDANPANNLGQHNTEVKRLNSPHAQFTFPVRNNTQHRQAVSLTVDTYAIPSRRSCAGERPSHAPEPESGEIAAHRREALARHDRARFPVPPGWQVEPTPSSLSLAIDETRSVTVDITAPDGFDGNQVFNVNAFDGERLAGGVTLYVQGAKL